MPLLVLNMVLTSSCTNRTTKFQNVIETDKKNLNSNTSAKSIDKLDVCNGTNSAKNLILNSLGIKRGNIDQQPNLGVNIVNYSAIKNTNQLASIEKELPNKKNKQHKPLIPSGKKEHKEFQNSADQSRLKQALSNILKSQKQQKDSIITNQDMECWLEKLYPTQTSLK